MTAAAAGTRSPAKTQITIMFFPHQPSFEIAEHVNNQCRELYKISKFNPRPSNARFRDGLVNGILASSEMLRIKTALHSTLVYGSDHIVHEVIPLINPVGQKSPVALRLEEDISPPHVLTEESVYRMLENACGRG